MTSTKRIDLRLFWSGYRIRPEYAKLEAVENTELEGAVYTYPVKHALCARYGAEAVYQPFEEEAGKAFSEAVPKDKGIISLEKIKAIPKKHNRGKRPLSMLLGWGEIAYTRFLDGQVPSREYSDLLERIYEDPSAYYRALIQGKSRITETAFRKSEKAVDAILEGKFPDSVKIYEVSDYFCSLSESDITAMMIQKLTYYAQGFGFVFLESPLFVQNPRAWAAGPVYGQLWLQESLMLRYRG